MKCPICESIDVVAKFLRVEQPDGGIARQDMYYCRDCKARWDV